MSETLASYGVEHDANGSRVARGLDAYTYDKRNRLVEAQAAGGVVQSIYDYRGQRVAKVANGVVTRYFGDGFEREDDSVNRKYIFAGGVRVAMHEAPVGGGSASLAVEAPVQVASGPGGVVLVQLRDGALGGWVSAGSLLLLAAVLAPRSGSRRVRRAVESGRVLGVVVVVLAGSAPVPWAVVPLAQVPLAQVPLGAGPAWAGGGGGGGGGGMPPGEEVRHFHVDRLGSTMVVTSGSAGGTALQHLRYGTYGEVRGRWTGNWGVLAAPAATEYGFTGYETDYESGLQYAGARFYDPELGLFLSLDPARQFASPYSYTGGNPVNLTDPSGAFVEFLFGMLIAAAIGFVASAINAAIHGASFGMAMRAGLIGAVTAMATAVVAATVLMAPLGLIQGALTHAYTALGTTTSTSIAVSATMAAPSVIYGLTQSDYGGAIALGIGIGIAVAGRVGIGRADTADTSRRVESNYSGEVSREGGPARLGHTSVDKVALKTGDQYNPLSAANDREYAGLFYKENGVIASTPGMPGPPCNGGPCGSDPWSALAHVPRGATIVADWHTHGAASPGITSEYFSSGDIAGIRADALRLGPSYQGGYLFTPGGNAYHWAPISGQFSPADAYRSQTFIGKVRIQ